MTLANIFVKTDTRSLVRMGDRGCQYFAVSCFSGCRFTVRSIFLCTPLCPKRSDR